MSDTYAKDSSLYYQCRENPIPCINMLNSFPTRNVINSVESFQSSSSTYETCFYPVMKLCFISVDMWTLRIIGNCLHKIPCESMTWNYIMLLVCCVLWVQRGLRCLLIFLKPQIYTDTLVILVQFLNTCPIIRQAVIFFSAKQCISPQQTILCLVQFFLGGRGGGRG